MKWLQDLAAVAALAGAFGGLLALLFGRSFGATIVVTEVAAIIAYVLEVGVRKLAPPRIQIKGGAGRIILWLVIIFAMSIGFALFVAVQVTPALAKSIHVKREIVYARILYFRDRELDPIPVMTKEVGRRDTIIRRERALFDEGQYIHAFYLHPHQVNTMQLHASSSGVCDVTAIIPGRIDFRAGVHGYVSTDGGEMEFFPQLYDEHANEYREYVLYALNFYNSYQYNESANRYESDGGAHIFYPTDEFQIIFDFSALDFPSHIPRDPKLWLVRSARSEKEPVNAHYENGVLVSEIIRNLDVGADVHCTWEWSSESEIMTRNQEASETELELSPGEQDVDT